MSQWKEVHSRQKKQMKSPEVGEVSWNMISQVETGAVSMTQITSLICLKGFKLRNE